MPIVYLLRSHGENSFGDYSVERMTLHPRVSTKSTLAAWNGEAFTVPHRVAYRGYLRDCDIFGHGPWRYSCLSRQVDGCLHGVVIGDGSDAAALAWLLEGERAR